MKDFGAFTDDDPDEKSTRVLLERLEIAEDGALILIRVQGSHFLWKMVRRIVGVLAAVGRGEMTLEQADALIQGREPPRRRADASRARPHRPRGCSWKAVLLRGRPGARNR